MRPKSSSLLAHSTDLAHKRGHSYYLQSTRLLPDLGLHLGALTERERERERFLRGQRVRGPFYVERSSLQDGLWCTSTQSRSSTSPLSWEVGPCSEYFGVFLQVAQRPDGCKQLIGVQSSRESKTYVSATIDDRLTRARLRFQSRMPPPRPSVVRPKRFSMWSSRTKSGTDIHQLLNSLWPSPS